MAPSPRHAVRHAAGSRLMFLTSLPALDGTLFAMGATGRIGDWGAAVLTGLTVIAGANAWAAARTEFGRRDATPALVLVGVAVGALCVAAAWAGGLVGDLVRPVVLPYLVAVGLVALAAETIGWRVPRLGPVRVAPACLVLGLLVEAARWTL